MSTRTVVFEISAHGLGHLAQTAPVVERLLQLRPSASVVIRSRHPHDVLSQFVRAPFAVADPSPEVAMVAPSAMTLDIEASRQAYDQLHHQWDAVVEIEARRLADLRPALVVSNVNYLPLAAAQRARLPNMAFCCVNWLDIYRFFLGDRAGSERIVEEIADAYRSCDLFLQPVPHMPMSDLPRRRPIGVIARRGVRRAVELRRALAVDASTKIVLVTLGGLAGPDSMTLPAIDGVHWLLREPHAPRPDVSTSAMLDFSFIDLFSSVDAVVGKDGYGTVAEAACAGMPLVMVPRPTWPESACLIDWATANCNFAVLKTGFDDVAGIGEAVRTVLDRPTPPPHEPLGIEEAASLIAASIPS